MSSRRIDLHHLPTPAVCVNTLRVSIIFRGGPGAAGSGVLATQSAQGLGCFRLPRTL